MFRLFFYIFFLLNFHSINAKKFYHDNLKNNNISILNADFVEKIGDKVILKGNVHLKDNLIEIQAKEITYDKKERSIVASGDVYLKDSKGNLYYAEEMDLLDSLKKGKIKNIQIKLSDKSRISARESLIDLTKCSKAKKVKYSCCENCKIDPERPLVWEIDSDEIVYDHETENINYKNAVFKFLGVPLFFFPKFVQLSPKIERKSGFLFPRIIMSQKLGVIAINSYLFALSKSSELLLNFALTTKGDRLLFGEYNKKFINGDISIGLSITDNVGIYKYLHDDLTKEEEIIVDKIKKRGYRGHIDARVNFWNKTKDVRVFSDVKLLSDKSYFNRYSFIPNQENEDDLNFEKSFYETNIGLEYIEKNKYALFKMITFQSTLTNDTDFDTPFVTPYCEVDITKPLRDFHFGGDLNFYLSLMNCDFKGGEKERKAFIKIAYLKNYITKKGIVFDFNLGIIAHLINVNDDYTKFDNNQINNCSPKVSLKTTYPMNILYKNGHSAIFTPEILLISSLRTNKNFEEYLSYSNEFGDYFEINKSNLLYNDINAEINSCFIKNRAIVGLNYEHFSLKRKIFDAFIGQMFFAENVKIDNNRGFSSEKSSDIILNGNVYINEFLSVNYNLMMTDLFKNFPRRNFLVTFQRNNLLINGGFSKGVMFNVNKNKQKFETFFIDAKFALNNNYEFFASKLFGDRNCKSLRHNIGLRYQDECFSCELKFEKVFFRKVDCKTDTRIVLSFSLKNLGEFKINQRIKNEKISHREYGYF